MQKTKQIKEFDRKVCFTFFEDYRKTAKEIEKDYGKAGVADYYNAIIDYALYEDEPEMQGVIKYLWHTTKSTIDKSIDRRANGFSREDTEKTEMVLAYKKEHPNATQQEISDATGISKGKVNKVLKSYSTTTTDTITDSISSSNTTREREREHVAQMDADAKKEDQERKDRALEDLTDEELKSIKDDFKKRIDYKVTRERLRLNRQVSKEIQGEIDVILEERKKLKQKEESQRKMESLSESDKRSITEYLEIDVNEIPETLAYIGCDIDYFLKWVEIHGEVFRKEAKGWQDFHGSYNSYIDFVKMGVRANPLDAKRDEFYY